MTTNDGQAGDTPEPLDLSAFEGMTPGPFKLISGLDKALVVAGKSGDIYVAEVPLHSWGGVSRAEGEANARAIAAVPALIAEVARLREDARRLTALQDALAVAGRDVAISEILPGNWTCIRDAIDARTKEGRL